MEKNDIYYRKKTKRWLTWLSCCLMLLIGQLGIAQYCMPSSSNANYEYITNVTFAGIDNTTGGNTGLNNYTSQTATVYKDLIGEEYTLSVSIEADSNEYVYVFIDWNQNGVLDDSGEVYVLASGTSANGPFTTQVTVPAEAVLGSTRMRVILNWNSAPTPCTSPSYGEIEDYTVTIAPPPPCPAPSALTAEVTANSATLGWTGTGNFDIKWGASGFDVETEGTLVAGASNPYNLGGLTTGVSYQFYVRQDCDGDFSDWAGPFSFVPNNFKVIGAGDSNTNGIGNDPIDDYYSSMRYQTVYTAAELTAAGFVAYNELTGLGFSVSEGTNTALLNYQIRIGHTTASNAGAHIDSPDLITVRNPASYLPTVVGVDEFDMLTFDTNFVWNGVDNIVIDICTGVVILIVLHMEV